MPVDAAQAERIKREADKTKPRGIRASALVQTILARSMEPWIDLTVGGTSIGRLRLGSVAMFTGAPGAGKTTLVLAMATEHDGAVIFVSVELDGDELVARVVGMRCDASWEDVLRGRVARSDMERVLDLPNFVVLDGDDARAGQIEHEVAAIRTESPSMPILVIVDYLQIVPCEDAGEVRARVAAVAQDLRRIAKRYRVVVLGISQPSRANGKALSSGEITGAETMTTGAESAEIERAAYLTFAIGAHGQDREDGTRHVDLNVGKGRFGGGDRVIPMSYCGRSGKWLVAGEGRAAAEVKIERQGARDQAKTTAACLAMLAYAGKSPKSVTREELRAAAAVKGTLAAVAITSMLATGELVEVAQKKPRARTWQIWTPAKAEAAGVEMVE